MTFRRTLKLGLALALLLPLLAIGGPASAQRSAPAVPAAVTAAAVGPKAYVVDIFENVVYVIDLNTNTVLTKIPVGFFPPGQIEATPDGSEVWVPDGQGGVAVIDTASDTVVDTITGVGFPSTLTFSPDGTKAYLYDGDQKVIFVVSTATRAVTGTIQLEAGSEVNDMVVSPNGAVLYAVNSAYDRVDVINTATNTVVTSIPVGDAPAGLDVSPDGTRLYVSNGNDNTVSVINTATNAVIATLPVGQGPRGVTVTPDGSKVYVAGSDDFTITVINTATNTVAETIYTNAGPLVTIEATSTRVYSPSLGGSVVVIDQATNAYLANIPLADLEVSPGFTYGIAIVGDTGPRPSATPTITTQASANNLAGAPVRDTATLSGGANPTGEVVFRLYDDPLCSSLVHTTTNPVVGTTATATPYLASNAGTYYWRAVYTGDANNNPNDTACNDPNETVVISPFQAPAFTQTITGDYLGPLTDHAGESIQLLNARVVGPVTVEPGGKLTVTDSQISRGIVANSPGFLLICGSQISGPSPNQAIGVFNSTVPIRIGDTSFNCAGNRIAGDVNLIGNVAVDFSSNQVVGNVTINNSGPGTTLIKSNNIRGTLACSGNNPPPTPTRPLTRNTVTARSGQCTTIQ
jgi:YVTN family beta-propeller protein